MISACCIGALAFQAWRQYHEKGFLSGAEIFALVTTLVMFAIIVTVMKWWADKP